MSDGDPGASQGAAFNGPSVAADGTEAVPGRSGHPEPSALPLASPEEMVVNHESWADHEDQLRQRIQDQILDAAATWEEDFGGVLGQVVSVRVVSVRDAAAVITWWVRDNFNRRMDSVVEATIWCGWEEQNPDSPFAARCRKPEHGDDVPHDPEFFLTPKPAAGGIVTEMNTAPAATPDGCICDRAEGQPGYGLLCPIHGDPISRKNVTEKTLPELLQEMHATQDAIVEMREHAAAPRDQDGRTPLDHIVAQVEEMIHEEKGLVHLGGFNEGMQFVLNFLKTGVEDSWTD